MEPQTLHRNEMGEVPTAIDYLHGIPEEMRAQAAALYEDAFGQKFAVAVPDSDRRAQLLVEGLELPFAISAIEQGQLVGLAGYQTEHGSLTGGVTYKLLRAKLGLLGSLRAALVFALYERSQRPGELLMDGIVVDPEQRGQGVGTALLSELASFAKENGFETIRLDVIDTNPAARRMYERNGFVPKKTEHFGRLRWLLGFGASTTLIRKVE